MPMPNNGYQWRPNDRSSLTNQRYQLEADKWLTAIKGSRVNKAPINVKQDIVDISTLVSIPLLLLSWIVLVPIYIIRELIGFNIKVFMGDEETGWRKDPMERYRVDVSKFPNKPNRKPKTPTDQEMEMIRYVQAETAKIKAAKGKANG